jgi:hydroxymethylbilane synthase
MWQANWVARHLAEHLPDADIEIVEITTRGDRTSDLAGLVGMGHFTSELEAALLDDRIDVAVHSLKDLPVEDTSGVTIAAIPTREEPSDVVVARAGVRFDDLPAGARIGTGSPRRTALLRARRPDLEIVGIRGNVDTRLRKVQDGEYDAIVLAAAGLIRLGLDGHITDWFGPREFPPAPGQGALAVQVLDEDSDVRRGVANLDDPATRAATEAERAFLGRLGGGCSLPIGAYGRYEDGELCLLGWVGSVDGRGAYRVEANGEDPQALARIVADRLLEAGAKDLL